MNRFIKQASIHCIGIGGAGMCGLAQYLLVKGYKVTGSDRQCTETTQRLEHSGATIQYHHQPDLVRTATMVIYSSAITQGNPEMKAAAEASIPCIKRAEALGDIMRSSYGICIAGTHGKTTTTGLTGSIFSSARMDPTIMVGGTLVKEGTNAVIGNGQVFIAEADEYDRSFLKLLPSMAIITNIEEDHLDVYRDISEITEAFLQFMHMVPFFGSLIMCIDDPVCRTLIPKVKRHVASYGTAIDAQYRAENIQYEPSGTRFTVFNGAECLGSVQTTLGGEHNVRNTLAAIAAGYEYGIQFEVCKEGVGSFPGVCRRFEIVGRVKDITVVDDYAHHPSEIEATIVAARSRGFGRVIAVFQPHLYTRTRDFLEGFCSSLALADRVLVVEIYAAREKPLPNVSGVQITDCLLRKGYRTVDFIEKWEMVPSALASFLKPNDVVLCMGAGDIGGCADILVSALGGEASIRTKGATSK